MQIEITDRVPAALDEVALRSPQATFYHTSTWLGSLADAFGSFKSGALVVSEGEQVVGYLPYVEIKRPIGIQLWSLPFGTYGGPAAGGRPDVARALVDRFIELRRQPGMLEVGLVDFASAAAPAGLRFEPATTQVIQLPADFDDLWARFEKSKRRQARKAERDGIAVVETDATDDVRAYYELYKQRSRAWGQSLVYPFELLDRLVKHGGERVKLFVANDGDRIIGGHLNFYFRDAVIAWNGVTAEHERASQASTLLYSACLRNACDRGFKTYNLGASLGKSSLEDYKRALGAQPFTYQIGRWRSFRGRLVGVARRLARR